MRNNSGLRKAVNAIATRVKGSAYEVDPELPLSAVFSLGSRRAAALGRGVRFARRSRSLVRLPFLGDSVQIRNSRKTTFGRGVTIGRGSIIDGVSRRGLVFGDNVTIGPYCVIEATGVVSSLGEGCVIGDRSGIGAFSYIGAAGGVEIGCDVIMGQRISFHSENHVFDDLSRSIREQGVTRKGIQIEDDCWVGANVIFLDGAHVGTGCVIAAGSVVRGSIPPYSVVAGVPARVIRSRK